MGLFDGIEKFITEHGSASILKEHLSFIKEKYLSLEKEATDLCLERDKLSAELSFLKDKFSELESENSDLKNKNFHLEKEIESKSFEINPHGYVCDHCGSPKLKRTGNRLDPTFGDFGAKVAVFICTECEKESTFSLTLKNDNLFT